MDKKEKMDFLDTVIDWAVEEDGTKVDMWLGFAAEYLKMWGWNEKAIQDFLGWGEDGFNNDILHFETDISDLFDEVHYGSDRMSLDRLFRCHVKYRTLKKGG